MSASAGLLRLSEVSPVRYSLLPALLASLACDGPPLEFGPCRPERVGHVKAFGYFNSAKYLDETAPYSSLVWGGAPTLAAARALGIRAVIDVQSVFKIAQPSRPGLAEIEAAWAKIADELKRDLPSLAALYTCDEPYWNASINGVSFDEVGRRLEEAARIIHATPGFENVPVATVFARPELDLIASGSARNPAGYAWVGFDQYGVSVNNLDRSTSLFLSLLRPNQRVIAVPDAILFTTKDLADVEERIAFWLAWIERHPQVIVIAPWTYRTGSDAYFSWTGARDLPSIRDRYAQIGQCIIDTNAMNAAERSQAPARQLRQPSPGNAETVTP
jgi:hypothetical protein